MRVLQINSVCGFGSTGRIATDLYDVLEREGHECCIAYGRGSAPDGYKTIKIGNKFDFYSHVLKTRLLDLHGFGSIRATKNFIQQIEEYKPDIIHLHNVHGYFINIKILFDYLSTLHIPIIWLFHDAWPISGHSAHFELDKDGAIPTRNTSGNQHKEYPKSIFFDNSKNNYLLKKEIFTKVSNMTIVTPSLWLANLVRNSFLNKYQVETIHNGIDLTKFTPTANDFRLKNNLQNKKIILGVASVWSEKKGLHVFNELADRLDDKYKILLVGITEKNKKNVNSKIMSIDRTESIEELACIYSTADIFVNPTLEDNFPTTNLEALACGTPVITFNTGGSAESLTENCGIVVEKGNLDKLIQGIINLSVSNVNGIDCLKRAEIFNKNHKYNEYIDLYLQLMN